MPGTPNQNSIDEKRNRMLKKNYLGYDKLFYSTYFFVGSSYKTTTHILNNIPTKIIQSIPDW